VWGYLGRGWARRAGAWASQRHRLMITGGLTFNDQQFFFFSVVLICFDIVLTIKIIKHQMGSSNGDQ